MFNRITSWLRVRKRPEPQDVIIIRPPAFIPWPPRPIYTTKHKRGPAKGRRRYQPTHGRDTQ
ncbi:hypothetical protein HNR62_001075 [Oceanisphaera litoralis]|nr:hypothetical protein [Oceanisphaera litoralis]